MKSIAEIERMSPESMEKISDDLSIQVPASVRQLAENAVMGASEAEELQRAGRRVRYVMFPAAAVLAACLAVILLLPRRPEDTFDDPALAYAEIEKTLEYISAKMDKCLEIASEAEPVLEKTTRLFYTDK